MTYAKINKQSISYAYINIFVINTLILKICKYNNTVFINYIN